jgi:two-component system, response regulator YesN
MVVDPRVFERNERLEKVRTFVCERIDHPIYLDDVAAAARLEPKYFSAFFRDKTGVSFFEWLASYRVGKAMELLVEEDLAIWEVGERVGMEERTFRRTFSKYAGMGPRQYRERVRRYFAPFISFSAKVSSGTIGCQPPQPRSWMN